MSIIRTRVLGEIGNTIEGSEPTIAYLTMSQTAHNTTWRGVVAAPPPVGPQGGGHKKVPGAAQGARCWVGKDKNGVFFFTKVFLKF